MDKKAFIKKFIEKYCVIENKDKDNKKEHIKLKDYQIKFIDYLENMKNLLL